ncbi:putative protein in type-1 retrotransposable element R1DM [Hypsizygus marmoreus]|uniref:Reverse transcriptase domain-containing protein n=1 Tax=Hypsizygus marmoreus TaxID=39966 RepID=A0A369JFS0_HYPMA|nr:putative protein in type-1 retrotransposable element R1DM [Hypsizygus marmoreus]
MEWPEFLEELEAQLAMIPEPQPLKTEGEFKKAIEDLTHVLQETITRKVKMNKPRPHSKRWWNSDLTAAKRQLYKLSDLITKFRVLLDHPIHDEYRKARNAYSEEIWKAKVQHWSEFLEHAIVDDIWMANKYISEPIGDGGCPRVPTLKTVSLGGQQQDATSNEDKAHVLAKAFFPEKPATSSVPQGFVYPPLLTPPPPITEDQIMRHIKRLSPYKASGPDGIPNVVLQKSANLIAKYLLHIYRAVLALNTYYDGW